MSRVGIKVVKKVTSIQESHSMSISDQQLHAKK